MEQEQLPGTGLKQVQLAAIREIFRATAMALPLPEILPLIANVTIIAFDARSAWLMLTADGQLQTQVARGEHANVLMPTVCSLGEGAAGVAAMGTTPTTLWPGTIDQADPVLGSLAGHAEPVVLVPIVAAGRHLGLLGAAVPLDTLQDTSFLVTLAEQAALVLESTRLRGEAQTWRRRLDAVVEQLGQPVLVYDRDSALVALNAEAQAWLSAWEVRPGDSLATVVKRLGLCDHEGRLLALDQTAEARALKGTVVRSLEQRLALPDGSERFYLTSAVPLRTDGQLDGAVVIFHDITERAQLLATAEATLQARDELMALLSHDLKSPLTAVMGQAQLMRRRLTGGEVDPARLLRGLGSVEAAARQMHALLDELLDLARLQAGRSLPLNRQPHDLVAMARHMAERLQIGAERHDLRVTSALPELMCVCDERRMERVMENLLSNAIKYSPTGSPVTVCIARQEDAGRAWAVVVVTDTGIGIPSADLPRIFERFHRASNTAGRIYGTGLGLASARRIVEQHGGTIEVTSVEGQGSTFTVRLPLESA
ncbi:MAG: PAS domain-containing protein [Chloroflexales bacterium]|nr:PAS domain-containing protein [Chloroflexales bacterium]